jgi:hypothetical protein
LSMYPIGSSARRALLAAKRRWQDRQVVKLRAASRPLGAVLLSYLIKPFLVD